MKWPFKRHCNVYKLSNIVSKFEDFHEINFCLESIYNFYGNPYLNVDAAKLVNHPRPTDVLLLWEKYVGRTKSILLQYGRCVKGIVLDAASNVTAYKEGLTFWAKDFGLHLRSTFWDNDWLIVIWVCDRYLYFWCKLLPSLVVFYFGAVFMDEVDAQNAYFSVVKL